jgi:hypothetical protein
MRAARTVLFLIATALPASASDGFSIVVPGRPGVPVIINGVDASWSVVESDWGLGKNVHIQPTVYGGRVVELAPQVGHYYPSAGQRPGYGRLEIQPPANRRLPTPAESYHKSWSMQSAPQGPQSDAPYDPPAVILAPEFGGAGPPRHSPDPHRDFPRLHHKKDRH